MIELCTAASTCTPLDGLFDATANSFLANQQPLILGQSSHKRVQEVVHDHGAIFIASAGNNGPGLTTCGAPGGTSEAIISIGAYVSPALAAAGHAQRDGALPEGWSGQQYNWSSRGAHSFQADWCL